MNDEQPTTSGSPFRGLVGRLNALVTFESGKSMSDDDFIANIDALNLLCNTCDDLGLDRAAIREKMDALYPQLSRRIRGKENIQLAMPLIKALHRFIYGRGVDSADRGPASWRKSFQEMCRKVVAAYRENPLAHSADYLFALDTVSRLNDNDYNPDAKEYKQAIDSDLLEDIYSVSAAERIRRVSAYELSHHLFVSDSWEKWAEIIESVYQEDTSRLDDETFIVWREITDLAPLQELKRRSSHSKRMQVEYLQALIFTEFQQQRSATIPALADNLLSSSL